MKIATLSIGYADGLPRSLSDGHGYVLLRGQKAPIAREEYVWTKPS